MPVGLSANNQNLAGSWKFDEGSGNTVQDSSGNNNTGIIYGAKWANGKTGKALNFDGADDYVQVADSNSLELTEGITISMWLYQEAESAAGGNAVTKGTAYKLGPNQNKKYEFRLETTGGTFADQFLESNSPTKLNQWVHVAATYDSSTGTARIYINGVLDKESATAITGSLEPSSNQLWIGRGGTPYFKGRIDEVRIYDRALSPVEIKNIYELGKDSRPNIIVIMTDDQVAATVSKMNLLKQLLIERGMVFENSFVNQSQCCPSRATFLTGQHSNNSSIQDNVPPLGGYVKFRNLTGNNTLATWLQQSGYYTALIGKYLNGYGSSPTEVPAGWNKWLGLLNPGAYYNYTINEDGTLKSYGSNASDYQTDVLANLAVQTIQQQQASPNPFFLWLSFGAPHVNNQGEVPPAPRHQGAFATEPLPQPPSFNEADLSDKPSFFSNWPLMSAPDIDWLTTHYRERITSLLAVDEAIQNIITALSNTDQLQNTYIFFTSDNGYFLGEHRIKFGKNSFYEPSIRVPLIVRGPGVPAGINKKELVSNIDLAPTIVDIAGATTGITVDGRSLLPLLQGQSPSWRTGLLVQGHERRFGAGTNDVDFGKFVKAIRTQSYIYARHYNGEEELYDLAQDPYQLSNLKGSTAYSQIKQDLAQKLAVLENCTGAGCWLITPEPSTCPALPGQSSPSQDLDNDQLCEDATGNGSFGFTDLIVLLQNVNYIPNNNLDRFFDCTGNGSFGFTDLICLLREV